MLLSFLKSILVLSLKMHTNACRKVPWVQCSLICPWHVIELMPPFRSLSIFEFLKKIEVSRYQEGELSPLRAVMTVISDIIISMLYSLFKSFTTDCAVINEEWNSKSDSRRAALYCGLTKNDIYMLYYANVIHCLTKITFHGYSFHFWCYLQNLGERSFVYGNLTLFTQPSQF